MEENSDAHLHPDVCTAIDAVVAKFPKGQSKSALLMALRCVQDHYGYLRDAHLEALADYLGLQEAEVFEVVSFYSMYKRRKEGKHTLKVCHSISCFLCGSGRLLGHLEKRLGIKVGQTTQDGLFTLKETECLAACCSAPAMLQDDKIFHNEMTLEKADALIDTLTQSAKEESYES